MIVTGDVTFEWLASQNMYKAEEGQIGVPIDIGDLSKGLRWIDVANMTDKDFDILDQYYEMKTK
jgi:hypothetical protein